jgi:hypothetical protein
MLGNASYIPDYSLSGTFAALRRAHVTYPTITQQGHTLERLKISEGAQWS